jgi:glycosyltransferase involved in cell wall biosynthesis
MAIDKVIYIGPYIDESIKKERGLRTLNAAGSNRIARIGSSFIATGKPLYIISTATSLWSGNGTRRWILSQKVTRLLKAVIIYAPTINLVFLNIFVASITQLLIVRRLKPGLATVVVIYNFNLSQILTAIYLRLFTKSLVLNNIEDIAAPQLKDWLPGSRARPFQQLFHFICMWACANISHGLIVPSERFIKFLPKRKSVLVVTGCIMPRAITRSTTYHPVKILFAGKLEIEDGVKTLFEIISILNSQLPQGSFQVHICGTGSMAPWIESTAKKPEFNCVKFHGFVPKKAYETILQDCQICLALQDPQGRYFELKTPSKFYEFIGFGKAVVATAVGDLQNLSPFAARVFPSSDPRPLASEIASLIAHPKELLELQGNAAKTAEEKFTPRRVGDLINEFIARLSTA